MNKHTQGPWKIGTPPPNGEQTIGTLSGLMVAVATAGCGMPSLANARLIAQAPRLLEALEDIVAKYESAIYSEYEGTSLLGDMLTNTDEARAAIAAATGADHGS